MNPLDTLKTLLSGARPAKGLLHNCRFEGLGTETCGIEGVVERIRMAPRTIAPDARVIESSRHIAVFEGEWAIFADVFDGNIARIWILGPYAFGGAEPSLAVPFDPDLAQAGGDVFFAGDAHPDLAVDAAQTVVTLGRAIVAETDGPRTRAFAIRAFGAASQGAALFAVFRLRLVQHNVAGFTLMAARWDEHGQRIVRDLGSEATLAAGRWCPRAP